MLLTLCKYIGEQAAYLFFGVLTTCVNILTYYVSANVLTLNYVISTILAWCFSVLFAYITNKFWVFKNKNTNISYMLREMFYFITCRLFSGMVDLLIMVLFVDVFKVDDFLTKIIANFFVVVINYLASKFFIFKNRSS
ncbi:MAG: GtrA family protein [Clostridiaceae bacterium]|nr:GtrA family protein [Clostridiaceae bacterium]